MVKTQTVIGKIIDGKDLNDLDLQMDLGDDNELRAQLLAFLKGAEFSYEGFAKHCIENDCRPLIGRLMEIDNARG